MADNTSHQHPDETSRSGSPPDDHTAVNPTLDAQNDSLFGGAPSLSNFAGHEILDEIARGGVGVVYKARHTGLDRVVALKILQGAMRASSEQVQRFLYEARSAANLQHPHIVPIHDFGEQDGEYYFTMDYVEGKTLAELLIEGPLPAREALEIVQQVAEALHYAHQHGVVHRDIKPGNILIDKDGRVQVTDFGLAKQVSSEELSLTMTGQVMGTPRYMSPEQAAGKTAEADARSDIFSLGVTLYEMLTGREAFGGESVIEIIQKILSAEPPPPHKLNRRLHRDVETICLKAIEKEPERRYQTAQEFADDIHRFLAGEPIEARPLGVLERVWRRVCKNSKALIAYAVLLFVTISGINFALRARPGHLALDINTAGATVKLDGVPLSLRDVALGCQLKPGEHRIRVEAEPDYDPQEVEFGIKPGERRSLNISLRRRQGTVVVHTEPSDAAVLLYDNKGFEATFQGPEVVHSLPTGDYSLLVYKENYLADTADLSVSARATNDVSFTLLSINLWSTATSGKVNAVPVTGDFNSDGTPDAVVGDDDGNIYCLNGRNGIVIWVFQAGAAIQAPFSNADLNQDGSPEVIVGGTDRVVYSLNGQTGQPLWTYQAGGAVLGPSLVRDVNNDQIPDVIVGDAAGQVQAVSGANGALLWVFRAQAAINDCIAWAKDEAQDVLLAGSADHHLYCINPTNGLLRWKVDIGQPLERVPRFIANNRDASDTLMLLPTPTAPGDVRTHTPVSLKQRQVLPRGSVFPFSIDLDGDQAKETLVVTQKGTTCYASDGKTVKWSTPYVLAGVYTADVTGDGILDLIFNNGPQQIICLSGANGSRVGLIQLPEPVGRGYALEDVDRDGFLDLIVGAGRRMYCFSWSGGRQQWLARAETYHDAPVVEAQGRVFTKTQGGVIRAYDPSDSQPVWQVATSPQSSPYSGLDATGDRVVDTDARTRNLQVLDAASGQVVWNKHLPGDANSAIGTPSIVQDGVLVGDGVGGFYRYSVHDGTLLWGQQLTKMVQPAVATTNHVFAVDEINTLYCLDHATGAVRWKYTAPHPFPSAPLLADIDNDGDIDAVAVCDDGFVYAMEGQTGKVLWKKRLSKVRMRTRHQMVPVDVDRDGVVEGVVCSYKGNLICLDLKEGKTSWIHILNEDVLGKPVIGDVDNDGIADLLVGTLGRRIHCVSGKGQKLWSYDLGAQVRYSDPVLVPSADAGGAPLVMVATGPPENGLYCLSARANDGRPLPWHGPWKTPAEFGP